MIMDFILPETVILYSLFSLSFIMSSVICVIQDLKDSTKHNQHSNKKTIYKTYMKTYPLVLFNMFITIPITLLLFQYFHFVLTPFNYYHLFHIPISIILIDIFFYICHYTFHTYKFINLYRFHKTHHKIKKPVSITSLYFHPIDLVFGNILPLFLPILVLRSSLPILYLWTVFTIAETTYWSHSGIKDRCENHDLHHKYFKYNYGSGTYLTDKLFGTYITENK